MDKIEKDLYHGFFNWAGETYEFYKHAYSVDKAFALMITSLAKKVNLARYAVLIRFIDDRADNYRIQKEVKSDGSK